MPCEELPETSKCPNDFRVEGQGYSLVENDVGCGILFEAHTLVHSE
jgi:hypothetical protein